MASASTNFTKTDVNAGKESGEDKYNALEANANQQQNRFANQTAPMATAASGGAATIDNGQADATRAAQNSLATQLQAQANGTAPSLGGELLKQGTDRTLAGQAALAATNGGSDPALAARQQAVNTVTQNQALASQLAQQRTTDQLNAQNQLGGVLGGIRGQDQTQATNQAQLNQQSLLANLQNQQQTSLANQGAQIGVGQNNAQNSLGFLNALGSATNSDVSGQQFVGQQAVSQDEWLQQQKAAQAAANASAINGLIGGAISGASSIASGGLSGMMKK